MKRHVKGTVATYVELKDGSPIVINRPLRVLRNYTEWRDNPKHFGEVRIAELSNAIKWVLSQVPDDIIRKQDQFERNT